MVAQEFSDIWFEVLLLASHILDTGVVHVDVLMSREACAFSDVRVLCLLESESTLGQSLIQ